MTVPAFFASEAYIKLAPKGKWPTYNLPIEAPYAQFGVIGSTNNSTLSELYEKATGFIDTLHHDTTVGRGTGTQSIIDDHLLVAADQAGSFQVLPVPVTPTLPLDSAATNENEKLIQAMTNKERSDNYDALAVGSANVNAVGGVVNEYLLLATQKMAWMQGAGPSPITALLDPKRMFVEMDKVVLDSEDSNTSSAAASPPSVPLSRSKNTPAVHVFNTTIVYNHEDDAIKGVQITLAFGVTFRLIAVIGKNNEFRYDAFHQYANVHVLESLLDGDKLLYTTEVVCDPFDFEVMRTMRMFQGAQKIAKNTDPSTLYDDEHYLKNLQLASTLIMKVDKSKMQNDSSVTYYLTRCLELAHSETAENPTLVTDLAAGAGESVIDEYYNNSSLGLPRVTTYCAWGRTRIVFSPRTSWIIDEPLVNQHKFEAVQLNTVALNVMWANYKKITKQDLPFYQPTGPAQTYVRVGVIANGAAQIDPSLSSESLLYSINFVAWYTHVLDTESMEPVDLLCSIYDGLALQNKKQYRDMLAKLAVSISRLFILNVIPFLKAHLSGPIAYGLATRILNLENEEDSVEAFYDYYHMVVDQQLRQLHMEDVIVPILRSAIESEPYIPLKQKIWQLVFLNPAEVRWAPPAPLIDFKSLSRGIKSPLSTIYSLFLDELQHMQDEENGTFMLASRDLTSGKEWLLWNDFAKYKLFLMRRRQAQGGDMQIQISQRYDNMDPNIRAIILPRLGSERRYVATKGNNLFMAFYQRSQNKTLKQFGATFGEAFEVSERYITVEDGVREPILSKVSVMLTALVIAQRLMDYTASYPRTTLEWERDPRDAINRGHAALITLINNRDGVVVPKYMGSDVTATWLKWHQNTMVPTSGPSLETNRRQAISNVVNNLNVTMYNVLHAEAVSDKTDYFLFEDNNDNTVSATGSDETSSGGGDGMHNTTVNALNESQLLSCIMERIYNTHGVKRDVESFQRLWGPMKITRATENPNSSSSEALYYPWTLHYQERISIFSTALVYYLGINPGNIPETISLLEAKRLRQIIRTECDPVRNRALGVLDGMASFVDNNYKKGGPSVVINGILVPPEMKIHGYERACMSNYELYDFDFGESSDESNLIEWLHAVVASLYLICMTLDMQVLQLTSPLAWLSMVCASVKDSPERDFDIIDELLEAYFGTMITQSYAPQFLTYYLSLPFLYAEEFAGERYSNKIFQMLHTFLRDKDVDYNNIDLNDALKERARTIDFSRFITVNVNFESEKSLSVVNDKEGLVQWVTVYKGYTVTIPSVINIIRRIMNVHDKNPVKI